MSVISKIFGDANQRALKKLAGLVASVNEEEAAMAVLSDSQLREKTNEFKYELSSGYQKLASDIEEAMLRLKQTADESEKDKIKTELIRLNNKPLDKIQAKAFAVVREAAKRTLDQRHYDVQLIGGAVFHLGQVAELKTGEGKTLAATLAVYLNALSGKGVHVITVNDYLAQRDAVWMGQIYHFLGLSTGVIVHDAAFIYDPTHTTDADDVIRDQGVKVEMDYLNKIKRGEAYQADITYGTNNEFGFDYLRDNMVMAEDQKVQRKLNYAIIDEVDSILIDEARTPLIISAPDSGSTDRYYQFAKLVQSLADVKDYTIDEKMRAVSLTEQGIGRVEKALGVDNLYVEKGIQTVHHIEQALKAKSLFTRDKDYTIKDGQVIIVDEFTGRLLQGRRYSEGLHQAIEAKEGVPIQQESKTMATITFQNYFRLYPKLAGMTGTAESEAEELGKIYNLEVSTVPTHKALIRKDNRDKIFKNEKAKFKAVVDEIKERHATGQPVLVGTISIEKNEQLARLLDEEGVTFKILNAKHHDQEAEVIAQAGTKGAVTIATNMAGRGVDIILGGKPYNEEKFNEVVKLGGLHVIGTERHESRRIDNQLRGRSGRQGDPGSTRFFVSLEDDLMRVFGAERAKIVMKNWPEEMPIENAIVSKSIESAQKKVEGHNFDIRKHLVEYDDVANKQRAYIYNLRNEILSKSSANDNQLFITASAELTEQVNQSLDFHTAGSTVSSWDAKQLVSGLSALLGLNKSSTDKIVDILNSKNSPEKIRQQLKNYLIDYGQSKFQSLVNELNKQLNTESYANPARNVIKSLYLRSIDLFWVEHLETLQYLRTGIGLRGYGQRDPIVEYKRESKSLFNRLITDIQRQFAFSFMNIIPEKIRPTVASDQAPPAHLHEKKESVQTFAADGKKPNQQKIISKIRNKAGKKVGRNDACPCGSGKKFKKCHGT